ncbi:MAG: ATP-binding protein [Thaumarchaeota archaeon]|nr:ATP-binding protein [Nitrososphaerota archaeon]
MSYADLLEYNPWWKNEDAIDDDPQIQKWDKSILKWNPRLRQTFQPDDLIYSLRGPRQVGKTTLIKLEIRDFLKHKIPKWNIMYYSFEIENSARDVINVINEYLDRTKKLRRKSSRCFIFLDEISNVNNWQHGIKKLVDMGKLKNCTIIATGSHSIDLKHATERLPGRRGNAVKEPLDKIMPPMKFSEYVYSIDEDIRKAVDENYLRSSIKRTTIINQLLKGKIDKQLDEMWSYQKELDAQLSNYMTTGGIPLAIDEFLKTGTIQEGTYNIYLQAMIGDLKRAKKDDSYMDQLMPNIIKNIGNPVSWQNLKDNTDIGSHHTVEEYVKILADMFTLSFFYRYNTVEKRPKFDSHKKIYFHDMFFLHAINGRITQKEPFKLSLSLLKNNEMQSHLVENILSDHLIRLAFNRSPTKMTFDYHNSVFYWRGKDDREVDFVIKEEDSAIPIELKYQNKINREDYYGLIDFKKASGEKEALLITKDDLSVGTEATNIPLSLFLLLI